MFDQVRGATKVLYSSLTNAEATQASGLSAFTSDGFSLGSDGKVNSSGHGQVGWAWDAGDSNTTIAVGGENSSVYDQSQTWSGMLTAETQGSVSNPTYAFDGTPGNTSSTSARTSPTSTQGGIIFTPTNGYTVASIIEVYGGSDSDECFIDFGSGYGSAVSLTSGTWNTVYTGSGTITYLKVKDPVGGNATGFGGIRIDGKLLVDSGVSVPNVPSIASTVRANPSAGFSIVSYTGTGAVATVGHGLNSTPELIIIKNRDTAKNWYVNTTAIDGSMDYLYLNLTNAAGASAAALPTSSVFGLTTSHETNTSGDDHIALLFAPVEGYSAMGSYTGNNTNDGPFVYTGFKPAFVMIKISSGATANWSIFDNKREGYNGSGQGNSRLYPNTSDQEATSATVDLFSNGFKCVRATNLTNGPSHEYIYFAVAEHPFASNGGLAR